MGLLIVGKSKGSAVGTVASCLALLGSKGYCCLSGAVPSFSGLVMSTPRLRHRPQVEDEDDAALKLGSGTSSNMFGTSSTVDPDEQSSITPVVYSFRR